MAVNDENANRRTALLAACHSAAGSDWINEDLLARADLFLGWLQNAPKSSPVGGVQMPCGVAQCVKKKHSGAVHEDQHGGAFVR